MAYVHIINIITKPCVFKSLLFKSTISNSILFNRMLILLVKISMFSLIIICKIRNQVRKLTWLQWFNPKEWRQLFHLVPFSLFFLKTLVAFLGKNEMEGTVPSSSFWSFFPQKFTSCHFWKEGNKVNCSIWFLSVFSFTKLICRL